MDYFATPKKSCISKLPCPTNLLCGKPECTSCTSTSFGTPKEVRMVAIVSGSNKINTTNEGNKFGSYARVNAKRNAAVFSKKCQCNLQGNNVKN